MAKGPSQAGPRHGQTKPGHVGVGLKSVHGARILAEQPRVGFFEVHAENYMGAGGPAHRLLGAIAERYALSLHGVGLSLGGAAPPDPAHIGRLLDLIRRYRPKLFSEHLAWSSHDGAYFSDLLPLPYTQATVTRVAEHIDQVQAALSTRMLLENPSTYVSFTASTMSETDFLAELVRRTGCGLLLDVNNVHVCAINHGFDPIAYLDAFPMAAVGEIHLGGHSEDCDERGAALLIDTHDKPVTDAVWTLYRAALARCGAVPTLIEWDNDVPGWDTLLAQARYAEQFQAQCAGQAMPDARPGDQVDAA